MGNKHLLFLLESFVFDDDDGTGGVVANIFSESETFEVVVPESHFKGVNLLNSSLFSIIVTDFEMPVMKGSEFLKEIRMKMYTIL